MWEARCYSDGIPDEVPKEIDDKVPSYKKIALAIMKNDLSVLGINPPKSEYYSILKCIELNIEYKKPKRMTQPELKEFVFSLINTMIKKECYIKGYGLQFRIVDKTHSPVRNIDKQTMNVLLENQIVIRNGLVFNLNILANPFARAMDIKLPVKE